MNLHLPEGSNLIPEDVQRKLQFGDPTVGWIGNPNMYVRECKGEICKARKCDGWVVAESTNSGATKFIMHNASGYCNPGFIAMLAQRRNQSGAELADEIEANNQRVDAERAAQSEQAIEHTADRLYDVFKRS